LFMTAETVKIDTPDSRATSAMLGALPGCFVRVLVFLGNGIWDGRQHIRSMADLQNV